MKIFTDGACEPNPGKGGWAAIIVHDDGSEQILHGGSIQTTNNRMELKGPIEALKTLPEGTSATVVSDSQYVVNGITSWSKKWVKFGFRKSKNGPLIPNYDLWEELYDLNEKRKITWEWVRGHNGHEMNERADRISYQSIPK